jgi:hypothetical protein
MKRSREDERRALVGDFEMSGLSVAATGQGFGRAGFRRFPVVAGGGRQLDLQRRVGWRLVTGGKRGRCGGGGHLP